MISESVAYPTHATFVQVAGEGTWTSNAQKLTNNLRTKKESWPSMLTLLTGTSTSSVRLADLGACAL